MPSAFWDVICERRDSSHETKFFWEGVVRSSRMWKFWFCNYSWQVGLLAIMIVLVMIPAAGMYGPEATLLSMYIRFIIPIVFTRYSPSSNCGLLRHWNVQIRKRQTLVLSSCVVCEYPLWSTDPLIWERLFPFARRPLRMCSRMIVWIMPTCVNIAVCVLC